VRNKQHTQAFYFEKKAFCKERLLAVELLAKHFSSLDDFLQIITGFAVIKLQIIFYLLNVQHKRIAMRQTFDKQFPWVDREAKIRIQLSRIICSSQYPLLKNSNVRMQGDHLHWWI